MTADDRTALAFGDTRGGTWCGHTVQFYDQDASLIDEWTRCVIAALGAGTAVLVFATEAHRHALQRQLEKHGVDIDGARARERYVALDAVALLARIMRGDTPDADRFRELMGGLIERAAASDGQPRPVAIFGEMVALLCAEGNHRAAVTLEHLCNAQARTRELTLFCAYPVRLFPRTDDRGPLREICAAHACRVQAESMSGRGLPFACDLPLCSAMPNAAATAPGMLSA